MKLVRPVVALAVGTSLVVAGSAGAATSSKLPKSKPLVVTDAAGDADGSNNQFGLLPAAAPSAGGALSQKSADIVSFRLARADDGRKVKALIGTLTLSAPPAQGTDYRIRMSSAGCTTYFLEYEFPPGLGGAGEVRENCSGSNAFDPVDTAIVGNSIVWTIPISALPGTVKLGEVMTVKGAQTSLDSGAAVIPGLDQVMTDTTYKIGQ